MRHHRPHRRRAHSSRLTTRRATIGRALRTAAEIVAISAVAAAEDEEEDVMGMVDAAEIEAAVATVVTGASCRSRNTHRRVRTTIGPIQLLQATTRR